MATTFPTNNCDPRLIVVDDSTGCTLTRANIKAFTRQDFEDQGFKEVGMDRIIAQTKEARLAGVRERTLTDLLLSRHVALRETAGGGSKSIIAPYTLVPRRNVVNASYFLIEAGAANSNAGSGTNHAGLRDITVNTGVSTFKSALKSLEKYFLPGGMLLVENVDGSGNAQTVQFKIISAANANAGGVEKATVVIEPNVTSATWSGYSAAQKAVFEPTGGTVMLMANSVSDYESHCQQPPAVNDLTLLEYWQQTTRWTHQFNDEYLKALEAPLTSNFFKKFRQLPLAQQRKQQEMLMEQQFYNTVFYGQEINENQTVEGYATLPQVMDPANTSCALEFKANTLGIRTQLARCGKVSDKAGAALNMDTIMETCYLLKRYRETTSGTVDVIDCMTDRFTAAKIRDLMNRYYAAKYNTNSMLYVQPGQKITYNGATVLEYNVYDLPDQGVQLAVFTDPYFDDRIGAFDTANKSRSRGLWFIDWTDVAINVIRTNSAKRQTNTADSLYNCVITPNVNHYLLNSKTFEVRVGDTNRHALIENFSDACPTITATACAVTTS
tara:strand:+ start:9914 stop:11575 length:1662 start_codon:yes stop_codon:yes gene_type:complete